MPTHKHDPDLLRAIGARLQTARETRGLRQAELAEMIGIEPVTLSRYETGARGPSITTLFLASQALGTSLATLVDVEGPALTAGEAADIERALAVLRALDGPARKLALGSLDGLARAARAATDERGPK